MSRRKQSNPKPLKHDESDEESGALSHEMTAGSDVDPGAREDDVDSSGCPEEGETDWAQTSVTGQQTPNLEPEVDAQQNGEDPGVDSQHSDASSDANFGTHHCDVDDSQIARRSPLTTVFPELVNQSKHDIETDKPIAPLIKSEPPPSPEHGGVSSSSDVPRSNAPASLYTPKIKRRNRSRSRSRSKSGGVSSSPEASTASAAFQSREEAELALVNQLQLPSDVLYLREQDINIHGTPSVGWVVCCAIPLPQGSSLGPFQGQLVPPEAVKVGDLIVQFTNKKGQQALMNVAGQSGGWLALLRSAGIAADRNTHVYWEGGRIWCEVVTDIDIGTELRASFTFQSEDECDDTEGDEEPAVTVKEEVSPGVEGALSHQALQQPAATGHAALIYGCPFCGVRFSSPRTLQGHLSFYCSKKTSEQMVTPTTKDKDSKGSDSSKASSETSKVGGDPETQAQKAESKSLDNNASDQSSQEKTGVNGQVFKCKHCNYKAYKLSSLNRHMRMHNNDKMKAASSFSQETALTVVKSPALETFCKECRIQFSSLHTYRCHKEHYCAQRRKKALANPSAFAAMFHSPFSFSETGKVGVPSALQMATLNQGGIILPSREATLPGAAAVILTAPMLTASGLANISISLPAMIMQPLSGPEVRGKDSSPRTRSPPDHHHPLSSEASPRPSHTHFLSKAPSTSQKNHFNWSHDQAHKSKDHSSIKTERFDEDHPLDLSINRKEIKTEDGKPSAETFLQPDKDGGHLERRRSQRSTSPLGLDISRRDQTQSPPSPIRSSLLTQEQLHLLRESLPAQHYLRSDHLTPITAPPQLLQHPSLLVSTAGFLPAPGLPHLAMSPRTKPAPISPSGHPNGISKCADCNIVFYKHDNYLIHKKHYCSGKRRLSNTQISVVDAPVEPEARNLPEAIPKEEPVSETSTDSQKSHSSPKLKETPAVLSPSKHSNELKYKFYCVPCRIKFSNASILEAHKEYYCPAGKDSEHSVILHTTSDSSSLNSPKEEPQQSSPDPPLEEFTCSRCNNVFTSARLLRLHMCHEGFPCPHCDHVSITDNRLAEHMKVHAPTKAYRCTICGYRGNTARGMRMHGKTHVDEGLDFTDENMLEYHEPALVPVTQSPHPGAATDTELLRLKNEPYKRRRSRKAYEKFDFPLPKVDIPQTCPLCGQNFANSDFLASHYKVHEIAASQYIAGLMHCLHCAYIGKNPDDLRSHFEANHRGKNKRRRLSSASTEEDQQGGSSSSPDLRQTNPDSNTQEPSSSRRMVLEDPNSPEEEEKFSFRKSSTELSSSSQLLNKVKTEPMDEDEADDSSKLNHFLQMPNPSPESTNSDSERHFSSQSPCEIKRSVSTPLNVTDDNQSQENTEAMDTASFQEHEPGEIINHFHIKSETSEESVFRSCKNSVTETRLEENNASASALKSPNSDGNHYPHAFKGHHSRLNLKQEPADHLSDSPHPASPDDKLEPRVPSNFLLNFPPQPNPTTPQKPTQPTFPKLEPPTSVVTPTSSVFPSPLPFPYAPPHLALPYFFLPSHHSPSPPTSSMKTVVREDRATSGRYCQNCDISFSKHSTYLAHKKYYCTARPRGEAQPSAKA
ncbi:zinc finger protein ush-like [Physella acuta]|uniref:zinc finger protein ush-like n=1 Tax=Physella acuta TaxID=109671 RepID=UPI0027DDBC1D|nr:zinc finger protein ush-like [Physella acuta]